MTYTASAKISIMNLASRILLFVLALALLLSIIRCGYMLWQLPHFEDVELMVISLIQGLRFDLAVIGIWLLPAVIVLPLLAMGSVTRGLAKWLTILWLLLGVLVILGLEWITPYFMATESLRPDPALLKDIEDPVAALAQLWSGYLLPAAIGLVLLILVFTAFWARLEQHRLLRYPTRVLTTLLFVIVAVALCVIAIRSSFTLNSSGLWLSDSLISEDTLVNEITLNTAYKFLAVVQGGLLELLPTTSAGLSGGG